jgi:hypothetical protein
MVDPLGGAGAKDPRAPTINAKKCRWRAPWVVLELKIQECPPPTLRNIDGRHMGDVGARDPGAPTMNAKKHQRWTP